MLYFLILVSLVFTCAIQYFLSIWLMKIGYFNGYIHTFGGFLALMILYMNVLRFLVNKARLQLNDYSRNNKIQPSIIVKNSIFVFLLATFLLNYYLTK
jgi:hypothetical protein